MQASQACPKGNVEEPDAPKVGQSSRIRKRSTPCCALTRNFFRYIATLSSKVCMEFELGTTERNEGDPELGTTRLPLDPVGVRRARLSDKEGGRAEGGWA